VQAKQQLFACAIPRGVKPPRGFKQTEYLRKDHFFLFERFYYFLEAKQEHGLIGESDKVDDRAFVKRMESYFMRTALAQSIVLVCPCTSIRLIGNDSRGAGSRYLLILHKLGLPPTFMEGSQSQHSGRNC